MSAQDRAGITGRVSQEFLEQESALKAGDVCPAWCTDNLGCKSWNTYDDNQWRHHTTASTDLKQEVLSDGHRADLELSVDICAAEAFTVDWRSRTISGGLARPFIGLSIARIMRDEEKPGSGRDHPLAEVHWDMTADQADELAEALRQMADRLRDIEASTR